MTTGNKIMVFGGQGEGSFLKSKYLNDGYILDTSNKNKTNNKIIPR